MELECGPDCFDYEISEIMDKGFDYQIKCFRVDKSCNPTTPQDMVTTYLPKYYFSLKVGIGDIVHFTEEIAKWGNSH